ncbi:MAG: sulfatase-like hydrolase/transferase [Cyclobacteriaceae bacterium]
MPNLSLLKQTTLPFLSRTNVSLLAFAILVISSCTPTSNEIKETGKPNIVFIFSDDQTFSSINALGNDEIITPNLNRLVESGTTFTHAYNMGSWSGAVCLASRAMLISGRSVWDANQFRKNWSSGDSIQHTWGKLMESSGYDTYMTGKWHVDAPAYKVFQTSAHVRPGMPDDAWDHFTMVDKFDSLRKVNGKSSDIMPIGYNRPLDENDNSWSPTDTTFGGFWQGGKHWSAVVKDDALNFLDAAKKSENPFFMYLAFNAPHDPRQAPQAYQDLYNLDSISLPKSWAPEYPYRKDIANDDDLRDEALAPFPRTEYATKVHIKEYYASITYMDAQIGKILDALEASGKMENTYIFFTSDHGLAMGRHGLLGKQTLFDHSIRPPMMVVGPSVKAGAKNDADVYLQDAMASSLELAKIKKPKYVFFNSLMDLAKGQTQESHYDEIYGAYLEVSRMIRKDGYKLMVYPKINKVLLFDLENDPEEMNDLADNEAFSEKVKTMFGELLSLQKKMGDPLSLEDITHKAF